MMSLKSMDPALTVRVVDLRGFEYARIGTLARNFDLSRRAMEELIARLCLSHEIRVLKVGERSTLVNVADFHRALVAVVPPQNGLASAAL